MLLWNIVVFCSSVVLMLIVHLMEASPRRQVSALSVGDYLDCVTEVERLGYNDGKSPWDPVL